MYVGYNSNYLASSKICMVYAAGLMMRWIHMAPIHEMSIWPGEMKRIRSPVEPLSEVVVKQRWQTLHTFSRPQIASIFVISLCVATKQINCPQSSFRLKDALLTMCRLGLVMDLKGMASMEMRFLQHLQWRTHLRILPEVVRCDEDLCEYNLLVESMPALLHDNGQARVPVWDRLVQLMGVLAPGIA